ncbi:MAG: PulJ/GspJ family protein [Terrimicrobiaceae bacterium]
MKPPQTPRAFTLLEVLLAMGIFAISVLGMMTALNDTLNAASDARTGQRVRSELENRLAALEEEDLREMERVTELKSPAMTVKETIRREPVITRGRDQLAGFWRVSVKAEWMAGGERNSEEASILRFKP